MRTSTYILLPKTVLSQERIINNDNKQHTVTLEQGVARGMQGPLTGRGVSPFGVNLTKLGRGCKGPPPLGGVRGVPEKPFFLFLLAAAGGERGKKKLEDTPNPGRGLPAPLKLMPKGVSPLPAAEGVAKEKRPEELEHTL